MSAETADGSLLDDAWLAAPPRRSRLRVVLVGLLAAGLVFLGGVEVQKRYGAAAAGSPTAGGAPAGMTGMGSGGPPSGGFGGGGSTSGAPSAAASGQASGQSGQSGTSTDQAAVIGTLEQVKGDVWVIKDLGGTVHRVTVGSTVKVVQEQAVTASDVASGSTVDVAGTTDAAGNVTATTITIR